MISESVQLRVSICGKEMPKPIVIALFGFNTPQTVKNFVGICLSKYEAKGKVLSYNNSLFHRIIPGFMIQGGDFTAGNGTGGVSIYGDKFNDENFDITHDVGVISLANSGPNTNGSQFFITTSQAAHLNGKHTVFGIVTYGMDIVFRIEEKGSPTGDPKCPVRIVSC